MTTSGDKRVSELDELTASDPNDFLIITDTSQGKTKRILLNNLFNPLNMEIQFGANTILYNGNVPTTASDTGVQGQIAFDSDYIYLCVSENTWKRVAITTW